MKQSGFAIYQTPDTDYTMPVELGGYAISTIVIDYLSGVPTLTKDYKFDWNDGDYYKSKVIVAITDQNVLTTLVENGLGFRFTNIDLTACGDNIEIPEGLLGDNNCTTIYVTSAVKAKYPDNAKVVVPNN